MNHKPIELVRAVIITGNASYEKPLDNRYICSPIYQICCNTMAQRESEEYLLQHGFVRVK